MDIDEFVFLDDVAKEEVVREKGTFFINYSDGDVMFDVYLLRNYYASFCYDLSNDKMIGIIAHDYHGYTPIHPAIQSLV